MAQVTALAVDEAIHVDARRVGDIVNELGEHAAQNVIGLSLEQMAVLLTDIETALETQRLADAITLAERLSRLAWQVGLSSLAGVAVDLASCIERRDMNSLMAVRARLARVGNRSLTEIWECGSG
ncbi:hypothetical protein FNJ84_04700 [Paracoccus sp. M683]|uniref:hypothetical protein n=1 Tax=Paracoccus sp. M683 TaxID=2594268 RepID=UPI00117EB08F|nr:hypothetical protein [Paracoccus sp. M683]TRW98852.1 hypothetical protein FNJ84_04700 [Paracoccus sp. M683]